MEAAGYKRKSRRQNQTNRTRTIRQASHFHTVRSGGFEETQMICYLWDVVKSMEAVEVGTERLSDLKKQLQGRVRVEMRRYFARQKRRNVILVLCGLLVTSCATVLFGFVIGIDRVSGNSMYPYLNHGDWIVYSRGGGYQMDEVIVFERNGENYVKRVAGLPGDTVEISASGRRVVVNGTRLMEHYVTLTDPVAQGENLEEKDPMGEPLIIMDGQYLVLGDNRSVSIDSRSRDMGTVPEGDILGRVILIARMGQPLG